MNTDPRLGAKLRSKRLGRSFRRSPGWLLARFVPDAVDGRVVAASVALGVMVGFAVAVLEYVAIELVLHHVLQLPLIALVAAPVFGLAITHLILSTIGGGASPATSEEYVTQFHSRRPVYVLRHLPARLLGGVSTIGLGGAVGLEGPSIYLGSSFGHWLHRSIERHLGRGAAQQLLTAGAAAGVAAVFQAPATGVVFALESPYRDDVAHRALLPSLTAAASSFLAFRLVPFIPHGPVLGNAVTDIHVGVGELLGAVALGAGAGLGGRGFAWLIRMAKSMSKRTPVVVEILGGGFVLGALAAISVALFDEPLTLGPGVGIFEWVSPADTATALIVALFFLRAIATLTTIGAGGVGGLFIPLAVQGVLLGRIVADGLEWVGLDESDDPRLWAILGLAAFLAAGYRTPIAAVMFVAESTRGTAVVPALIAAAVSQLVAGSSSVSAAQRAERLGGLESRLALPISAALNTEVLSVPKDATISEFIWIHAMGQRTPVVPVVDENKFLGLCSIHDAANVPRDDWDSVPVTEILDPSSLTGQLNWSIRDAVAAMGRERTDLLAVVDDNGGFVGVVNESEIIKLDEILIETETPDDMSR